MEAFTQRFHLSGSQAGNCAGMAADQLIGHKPIPLVEIEVFGDGRRHFSRCVDFDCILKPSFQLIFHGIVIELPGGKPSLFDRGCPEHAFAVEFFLTGQVQVRPGGMPDHDHVIVFGEELADVDMINGAGAEVLMPTRREFLLACCLYVAGQVRNGVGGCEQICQAVSIPLVDLFDKIQRDLHGFGGHFFLS